jgi:tetratricopeptide (TPR) repeat protein
MKGRKIFGDLVPYGKVWRTGANSATRLKFADDVTIGGQQLKAGEYAVFTIPGEREWEIIINKGTANWGTDYKQELDVVRFKAPASTVATPAESFTIQFANVKPSTMDIQMLWDRTAVNIPVSVDSDKKIMGQIDQLMNKDNRPYFAAAMYYLDNGKDLNQAISWFDKAVESNPNAYWMHYQRANALAKLGRKKEALDASQRSMTLARDQKNDDYVALNQKLQASLK